MAVESATTIAGLNAAWPLGTDPKQEGDNHIRLIKSVLKADAASKAELAAAMPVGSVIDYAGAAAPTGWLFCYGQAVSRTVTYSALFAAIGTTYGVGDGSTTFNVPDLRGRVVAGKDDMGGASANRLTMATLQGVNGDVLGGAGGFEQHDLIEVELASHAHYVSVSGTTNPMSANATHGHSVTLYDSAAWSNNVFAMGRGAGAAVGTGTVPATNTDHNHAFAGSGSTDYRGGGAGHNNLQPTIILNKIIKI